jgi:hypothetical protein
MCVHHRRTAVLKLLEQFSMKTFSYQPTQEHLLIVGKTLFYARIERPKGRKSWRFPTPETSPTPGECLANPHSVNNISRSKQLLFIFHCTKHSPSKLQPRPHKCQNPRNQLQRNDKHPIQHLKLPPIQILALLPLHLVQDSSHLLSDSPRRVQTQDSHITP